jgi:hypothetical protein
MARRKGEATGRQNEQYFPNAVELPLPSSGFKDAESAMAAFHREHGIEIRQGRSRCDEGQWYVKYCFADPALADEFQRRFGGHLLTFAFRRRQ